MADLVKEPLEIVEKPTEAVALTEVKALDTKPLTDALAIDEEAYKKTNKKYFQIKRVKEPDYEKEVHEYVCPDGKVGYQTILRATKGEDIYVKSINVGPETHRDHDWSLWVEDEI